MLKYFNSLLNKIFSVTQTTTPGWIIFNIDLLLSAFSILLAYQLRFNFSIPPNFLGNLTFVLILVLIIRAITFYFGKTFTIINRHAGLFDLTKLIKNIFIGTVIISVVDILHRLYTGGSSLIPASIVIMDFFITVYIITSSRLFIKLVFFEFRNKNKKKSTVVIFGSEEMALVTKRALDLDSDVKYKILAFIDDKKHSHKKNLEGIIILSVDKIKEIIEKNDIDALIFAKENLSYSLKSQVIDICLDHKIKILSAPKINSWMNGDLSVRHLKKINIEDLLEREPIVLDATNIKSQLTNKVVLITGAAGSIGSEIARLVTCYNPSKIILLDQAESALYSLEMEISEKLLFKRYEAIVADITNQNHISQIFEMNNIDIIYHAAAYKHVPVMENNPIEAVHNNVIGTKILADLSVKHKVEKFVMISTDKAVNPTNIMGTTKRIAEMYTQTLNNISTTIFITTRFGNVLDSNGSAIPIFKKQIEEGGPVTVTHPEITRYFMTIQEACLLVLEASAMGKGGEIFMFDMGSAIKIIDIAKNMIRLSGLEVGKDIEIKFIGLRPGEKLYEELLCDKENALPTYHPKIMIAKVADCDFKTISTYINSFKRLIKSQENIELVKLMKELVPEYRSKNSIYEDLDKISDKDKFGNKFSHN
jgi:FlaA1/EpsC-like NDP-sugar epimerase